MAVSCSIQFSRPVLSRRRALERASRILWRRAIDGTLRRPLWSLASFARLQCVKTMQRGRERLQRAVDTPSLLNYQWQTQMTVAYQWQTSGKPSGKPSGELKKPYYLQHFGEVIEVSQIKNLFNIFNLRNLNDLAQML